MGFHEDAPGVIQGRHKSDITGTAAPDSLHSETPAERLARYRRFAEAARRDAMRVGPGELRDLYVALSERWDALAEDFERVMKSRES